MFTIVEVDLQVLRDLQKDAERYRFLRIDDDWGEDSGELNSWECLGQSSGKEFDAIVDSRIKMHQEEVQSPTLEL